MNITKAQLMVGCAFLLACIALAQDALAQTSTPTTTLQTPAPTATATMPTSQPALSALIAASPLPPDMQVRMVNLAANMSNRTDALIVRLELIMVRMDTRLQKMEAEGYATHDARFYLQEAQGSLTQAKTEASQLDAKVGAFITSQNYVQGWTTTRETYVEIKSQLMRTRQLLMQALESMKLQMQETPASIQTGTTTASSTVTTQEYAQ